MLNSVILFTFLFGLPLSAAARDFDRATDSLCFQNADPEMGQAAPFPWGKFAVKTGACQGIAGLAAAFFENAEFNTEAAKPASRAEVRALILRIIHAHRLGWRPAAHKTEIPGYANLQRFCEDYRTEFLRSAVLYNRNIATHEILKRLPEFIFSRGKIRSRPAAEQVLGTLDGFERKLQRGELPLLLYYSHVVLVYSLKRSPLAIVLTVYDSNRKEQREITFALDSAGLLDRRNPQNFMIWDITPERSF